MVCCMCLQPRSSNPSSPHVMLKILYSSSFKHPTTTPQGASSGLFLRITHSHLNPHACSTAAWLMSGYVQRKYPLREELTYFFRRIWDLYRFKLHEVSSASKSNVLMDYVSRNPMIFFISHFTHFIKDQAHMYSPIFYSVTYISMYINYFLLNYFAGSHQLLCDFFYLVSHWVK
jgi:hypothetical protein